MSALYRPRVLLAAWDSHSARMENTRSDYAWPRVYEFRFVVLLRGERRDGEEAQIEWRGWIRRVPDISELGGEIGVEQVAFRTLEELPAIVRMLMRGEGRAGAPGEE